MPTPIEHGERLSISRHHARVILEIGEYPYACCGWSGPHGYGPSVVSENILLHKAIAILVLHQGGLKPAGP